MRVGLHLDRLHDLIARSNITQNHWAMKMGLSRGHWSDIVNGKHLYPSAKTRERMLEAFKVEFDELFEVESETWSDHHFQASISDRYLIDKELGHGGMGAVYVARDAKLGRQVAIKVVSPEAVSGIGIQQFLKEIRYTARLQHPHILPLHDAGEAVGYPYYVMPLIRGGSVRDLLKEKHRLSVDETIAIARGVAAALTYAHQERVLHCDVKPPNVLLDGMHAYVADFGISRAIHAEALEWGKPTQMDSSAGTPAYVSPEQASGEQNLDPRSDVYSLACMVFEMLAGRPPFMGTTTMAIVAQRFSTAVPDIKEYHPELPQRVAAAVQRGMAVDVERRPDTSLDFIHALERGRQHHQSRVRETVGLVAARLRGSARKHLGLAPTVPHVSQTRKRTRDIMGSIKQDITYALRTFRRSPAFAAVVVLTLAFGIAANTFVFSMMNPYFFRPLPFGDANRLVQLGQVEPIEGWKWARFSLPMYEDWKERSRAFEDIAAYSYSGVNLTGDEGAEGVNVSMLTANMFTVLDAQPAIGRTFTAQEQGPGSPRVVVLGDGIWRRRYGADPDIVGRTIEMDGSSHTVIGVMPPDFNFPFGGVRMWTPVLADAATADRESTPYLLIGRLKPDWSIERATEELAGIQRSLGGQYPEIDGQYLGVTAAPIREALNFAWDILRMAFALMLGAVTFALIIACVNVASLTLARTTARTGEVAVRTALGAGRGRLVRQFLTESLVLAAAGGVLGTAMAYLAVRAVGPLIPEDLFKIGDASIDGRVLLFTVGVTLATPLLFGLAPAITSAKTNLAAALKEGGRGGWSIGSMRLRRALVISEIALAVALISGMGLMVRSFLAVQNADLGFAPREVLTVQMSLPDADYPNRDDVVNYFDRAVAETAALPGIRAAGTVAWLPLNHETIPVQFARPGQEPATPEEWPSTLYNNVSPGYFAAMQIPLVAGRDFTSSDGPDAPDVLIVSQRLAESYWPGENPLGQSLLAGDARAPRTYTIVGVAGDVKHEGIAEDPRMYVYRPVLQRWRSRLFLVLSTDRPASMIGPVRQTLERIDPNISLGIRPYTTIIQESTILWSVSSGLLAVLGGAALLIASLGIYGIIAYSVAQRKKEIGVRLALGATERSIQKAFVGESVKMGAIGLGFGLVLAVLGGRAMATLLFGVGAFDPVTLGGVMVLFALVSVLASLIPAMRASRVDPLGVLRYE